LKKIGFQGGIKTVIRGDRIQFTGWPELCRGT
jgi:hypothetical protein